MRRSRWQLGLSGHCSAFPAWCWQLCRLIRQLCSIALNGLPRYRPGTGVLCVFRGDLFVQQHENALAWGRVGLLGAGQQHIRSTSLWGAGAPRDPVSLF